MGDRHLLLFSPFLPPNKVTVAYRMHGFIEALEEAGFHLKIVSGRKSDWGQSLVFDLPTNTKNFWIRSLRELLSGIELGIRIIFSKEPCAFLSAPPFLTCLVGAWCAHLSKKYYILDLRDPIADSFLRAGRFTPNSIFSLWIQKASDFLMNHAVVIFVATHGLRENICQRYPHLAERCFRVWTGYDSEIYFPLPETENKFPKFTCIFHGNTGPLQDIPFLRSVASELKNLEAQIDILVCGPGPQSALVRGAGLSNFRYEPAIDPKAQAELVRKCHLGLSFRQEGLTGELAFSQAAIECIGSGLPVVSYPQNEIGKFLDENMCGASFAKKDPLQVAMKIVDLQKNPDQYNSLVGNVMKVRESISQRSQRQIVAEVLSQL